MISPVWYKFEEAELWLWKSFVPRLWCSWCRSCLSVSCRIKPPSAIRLEPSVSCVGWVRIMAFWTTSFWLLSMMRLSRFCDAFWSSCLHFWASLTRLLACTSCSYVERRVYLCLCMRFLMYRSGTSSSLSMPAHSSVSCCAFLTISRFSHLTWCSSMTAASPNLRKRRSILHAFCICLSSLSCAFEIWIVLISRLMTSVCAGLCASECCSTRMTFLYWSVTEL